MHYLAQRRQKLQARLRERGVAIYLVTTPSNITYLTGVTSLSHLERDVVLVITPQSTLALVSPLRYAHFAKLNNIQVQKLEKNFLTKLRRMVSKKQKLVVYEAQDLRVGELERLKATISAELAMGEDWIEEMRLIKEYEEINNISEACHIVRMTWEEVKAEKILGLTEKQVAQRLINLMLELGADDVPFGFQPIVAAGIHSAIPHHVSTSKKLEKGEVVLVDFGCTVNGYCSDFTRTIVLGKEDRKFGQVKQIVHNAYQAALSQLRPATAPAKIDRVVRKVIQAAGFGSSILHSSGHGLGLDIHELPQLSVSNKVARPLRASMVVTLEPGIYLNKEFGYRYEDTILITAKGCQVLT